MGRADELKLKIEALKLQLEIEMVKTARFLQNGAQARSETSGLGRYAKDLKAVLVPMPADDTMIPAWFKMADSLLKMLEVPEEVQGALMLPFLTEKVKTSVVSQSRSGTFSYGELKEKVLRELRLTPKEYRRCFPETKREVREQSCDLTMLTGSFGKAVTTEVVCVPVGLLCPSENTRRVSLPVTPELATGADLLLTLDNCESLRFALAESEHDLECGGGALVEELPDREGSVANGSTAVSVTHICDDNAERQAIRLEPNEGSEVKECCAVNSELRIGTEDEGGSDVSELDQVESGSDDLAEQFSAAVGAPGEPAHVCSVGEGTASPFAKERMHGESSAEAHHAFDVVGQAVASMPTLAARYSWAGKAIDGCSSREGDGDERLVTVLSRAHTPTPEKEPADERGSFATVWTNETCGRWIFGIKVRIKTDDDPLTFLARSARRSVFPTCYV
ncbi:hypothetical protein HPB50_000192 [Hyalomma asiaticum]|uniref:Uncharacterized protein n=1 Tax=Hyalomma asiaticum TaxID=266040 RepID=A0ACB7S3A8_HYAAI|nr:hypothetical protein HPB50_000192 [Hyalomma asiaticum]